MKEKVFQGDILKIDNIKVPVLVVSKDFFNESWEVIACPIFTNGEASALHIEVETSKVSGFVQCEKMKLFDLSKRRFFKMDRIHMDDIIDITDAIQGIFDYI